MGIFSTIGKALFSVHDDIQLEQPTEAPPQYSQQEYEEYMDGFRTGYPLVGQPDYPVHDTEPYKRGVKLGQQAFQQAGQPQIPYEE